MDSLLTAVKTVKQGSDPPLTTAGPQSHRDAQSLAIFDLERDLSSNQIIEILKGQPDREQLATVLATLDPYNDTKGTNVDIRVPASAATQILQLLVSTTIPDHWARLDNPSEKKTKDVKTRAALLRCLSSIAGLGFLVGQLRSLIAASRATAQQAKSSSNQIVIRDLLSVLAAVLEPKELLLRLYSDISHLFSNNTRKQVAWRELVSLIAAGKIVSTAAEALTLVDEIEVTSSKSWTGDGSQYSSWLGRNIYHMTKELKADDESGWTSIAFLTARAMSLGYAGKLLGRQSILPCISC